MRRVRTGDAPVGIPEPGFAKNPLKGRDAVALIGLVAVLEIELLLGGPDPHLAERFVRRAVSDGLVAQGATAADLRFALANLNNRPRSTTGEYDDPNRPHHGRSERGWRLRKRRKVRDWFQYVELRDA